jgi:hypothetical protein
MRVLGIVGAVGLGAVLLVGLYAKAIHPEGFAQTIRQEGLDLVLPAGVLAYLGLAAEGLLGFCLLLGLRGRRVLWGTTALVVVFLFVTGRAYVHDVQGLAASEASCGCFGTLVERSPAEAFWQDLLLLVPALALAWLGRPSRPASRRHLRLGVAGGLTLAVLVFAWFAPRLPLDDLATRLRPGTKASDMCAGEGQGRICMDAVIPELDEGDHVVLMTRLDDPAFLAHLPAYNDYALAGRGPRLWVVAPATEDAVGSFRFLQQPAFDVLPCPPGVLRPFYRRLPRAFLTHDGRVTETWQGVPPLAKLAAEDHGPDDAPGAPPAGGNK